MKNNILRNIKIDSNEKVYKEFRKIKAKGHYCEILLTTRRVIFYSHGKFLTRGKKIKKRGMNEIDIKSVRQLEYFIEYVKNNIWVRIIGLILTLGALYLGYAFYMGIIHLTSLVPYQPYTKYGLVGLIILIGMLMMFIVRKTLYLKIVSGLQDKTTIKFKANKYNELAIRYIASKIHP